MNNQGRLLSDLSELRDEDVHQMNALGYWTIEDIAGIIRLSEINPNITSEMIKSIFAYEFNTTQELVSSRFIKVIRDSIPDHEWYAIAEIEEPLHFGLLIDELQQKSSHDRFMVTSLSDSILNSNSIPTRINLLELYPDYFYEVRNQNQRGTCVAFAATALHEFVRGRLLNGTSPKLSEEFLYWASRNRQYREMPTTCHQCGTFICSALCVLVERGQCLHETIPYQSDKHPCNLKLFDGDNPDNLLLCLHDNLEKKKSYIASSEIPPQIRGEAETFKLNDWEIIELSSVESIKRTLVEGYPVLLGVRVYLSWFSPTSRHKGKINIPFRMELNNIKFQLGAHAILLVGYEDDQPGENQLTPGGGYFIIRNSWGKAWGDESANGLPPGNGILPYSYLSQQTFCAYSIKPNIPST